MSFSGIDRRARQLHGTIWSVTSSGGSTADVIWGASVVHTNSDPALADKLVHFVGRPRGNVPLPKQVEHLTAEQRLAQILIDGHLKAFPVYRSAAVPVVSVSDLSSAELGAAFSRGLNARRGFEPWALVLDRQLFWQMGFRPVVYADAERFADFQVSTAKSRSPLVAN